MICTPSAFPEHAIAEATAIAPARNKASDGICGDWRHQQRVSDHNPDSRGIPHAFDVTQDAAHFNAHAYGDAIALRVIAGHEWRVKYLVSWDYTHGCDKIFDPSIGLKYWRLMSTRDHASHLHTSFIYTLAAENSVAPYFGVGPAPVPSPTPTPGLALEDTMVLYPLKAQVPGRLMCATLDAGRKVVMLWNGAGLRGDLPVGNHREWKVPTGYPLLGMTASGVRAWVSGRWQVVPDGRGVVVTDALGEVYQPLWS